MLSGLTYPPTITTQYGLRPDSPWGTAPLLIQTKNSAGQASFAYFHHDQLGTPLQATDKAGNIVWAANFDAFGRANITTPQATVDKPTIASNLRLPGQYADLETGLHYNWHRYYDAEVGRYVTSDPIGFAGGLNRYVYVSSDPINRFDPTGEFAFLFPAAIPVAEILIPGIGLGLGVAVGSMIWPTQPDSNDNSSVGEVRLGIPEQRDQ